MYESTLITGDQMWFLPLSFRFVILVCHFLNKSTNMNKDQFSLCFSNLLVCWFAFASLCKQIFISSMFNGCWCMCVCVCFHVNIFLVDDISVDPAFAFSTLNLVICVCLNIEFPLKIQVKIIAL